MGLAYVYISEYPPPPPPPPPPTQTPLDPHVQSNNVVLLYQNIFLLGMWFMSGQWGGQVLGKSRFYIWADEEGHCSMGNMHRSRGG